MLNEAAFSALRMTSNNYKIYQRQNRLWLPGENKTHGKILCLNGEYDILKHKKFDHVTFQETARQVLENVPVPAEAAKHLCTGTPRLYRGRTSLSPESASLTFTEKVRRPAFPALPGSQHASRHGVGFPPDNLNRAGKKEEICAVFSILVNCKFCQWHGAAQLNADCWSLSEERDHTEGPAHPKRPSQTQQIQVFRLPSALRSWLSERDKRVIGIGGV